MKKILALTALCSSLAWSFEIGGSEFSPEIGMMAGKSADYSVNAYGRLWLGIANIVIAPQIKYAAIYNDPKGNNRFFRRFYDGKYGVGNLQYGLLAGYNIKVPAFRLTPYAGINQSSFSSHYQDTRSYNFGVKLKPSILPLSVGLEYEYQKPNLTKGNAKQHINGLQLFLGLHF